MSKILVIGGTSGIGEATAATLQHLGNNVFCPSKEALDVTSVESIVSGLAEAEMQSLGLDGIVFSAGINRLNKIGDSPYWMDDDREVMDVNVHGFMRIMNIWKMMHHRPISIVAVGSDAAERPMRTSMAYCASKAALHMAVRVAARELAVEGYRVNCVAPGMTHETGMQEYVDARVQEVRGWSYEEMRQYEATQEVTPGRISVDEVAATIVNTLFGPPHLNGSIITINGGR